MADVVIHAMAETDTDAVIALWHESGGLATLERPGRGHRLGPQGLAFDGARRRPVQAHRGHRHGRRGWPQGADDVAVDPVDQRKSLGGAMMNATQAWLIRHGVWEMQLVAREDNVTVKHVYERRGYRDTRTTCLQKIIGRG